MSCVFISCQFTCIYRNMCLLICKLFVMAYLRAYANNVRAHTVRAYEGKPLRMCRKVCDEG